MKCVSVCVLAAAMVAAMAVAGRARAQTAADFRTPGAASPKKPAPVNAAAQVAPAARPAMFAAASAASVKRLAPEQREEWRFLKEAAATSRFEAEASRMALARSSEPGVRSFAATLVNHHSAAGEVLQHMLHVRSMAPPMLSNEQRKTLNRLAKLHGTKFDREFMDELGVRAQQDDVQAYERASGAMRDPALKGWVDRTLPTLRYHLGTAERVMAGNSQLAKAPVAAPVQPTAAVRQASSRPPVGARLPPRSVPARHGALSTRLMGAGPAPSAGDPFGGTGVGDMQLGPAAPISPVSTQARSR